MAKVDKSYHKLLKKILKKGKFREDPKRDVRRLQIPSYKFKHKFKDGFPAITTKKLFWKGVVGELIWFLRGDTNIKYLVDNGIHIWDKDAANFSDNGNLGRVYGAQWRDFRGAKHDFDKNNGNWTAHNVDQITNLLQGLVKNPLATDHIVTAWNPAEKDDMALPPCHWSFEIVTEPLSRKERVALLGRTDGMDKGLKDLLLETIPRYGFTLKWNQRSVDTFLGLPFNIASYALLAKIIGELTNMEPLGIEGNLSNVHLYEPHIEKAKLQLERNDQTYSASKLSVIELFNKTEEMRTFDGFINDITIDDLNLLHYESYPAIPAEMYEPKK